MLLSARMAFTSETIEHLLTDRLLTTRQSVIREVVVPGEVAVRHSGSNAYRFLGRSSDLQDDPEVKSLFESKRGTWSAWQLGKIPQEEDARLFLWYDIQG